VKGNSDVRVFLDQWAGCQDFAQLDDDVTDVGLLRSWVMTSSRRIPRRDCPAGCDFSGWRFPSWAFPIQSFLRMETPVGLHVNCQLFLSDFTKVGVCRQGLAKLSGFRSHGNPFTLSRVVMCVQTEGQSDFKRSS
jgi:hypothetical protein